MTALCTAEAALRRAPDDPGVPVTVSGAEAAALVAELDRLRVRGDELAAAAFAHLDHVPGLVADHTTAERLDRAAQAWRQADA